MSAEPKARARALAAWLLSSCALYGHAAELIPAAGDGALAVEVRGLRLPDRLRADLTSGLTNHILIRLALTEDGDTVTSAVVAIAIRYDLWEETFRMTMVVDQRQADARTFSSVEGVIAALSAVSVDGILDLEKLERGRAYTLQADVLFDPIDRERMEKIREWVARNSTLPAGSAPVGGSSASRSANLFNRIFEQYAAGADIASAWRESVTSAPFRPESLEAPSAR